MLLMWTNENRGRYDRSKLRYPSDLTDDEWVLVVLLIPPAKRGGNKRTVDMRGYRQLGGWAACEVELSQIGGRDDNVRCSQLRRLSLPG